MDKVNLDITIRMLSLKVKIIFPLTCTRWQMLQQALNAPHLKIRIMMRMIEETFQVNGSNSIIEQELLQANGTYKE